MVSCWFWSPDDGVYFHVYLIYIIVPDGPPQDIRVQLVTPNQVRFFWSPPLEELQNGLILSYMISCVDSDGARDPITEMVTAESIGMATVSGFIPATLYNCFLSARTVIGFGVSGTIQVLTGMLIKLSWN